MVYAWVRSGLELRAGFEFMPMLEFMHGLDLGLGCSLCPG